MPARPKQQQPLAKLLPQPQPYLNTRTCAAVTTCAISLHVILVRVGRDVALGGCITVDKTG